MQKKNHYFPNLYPSILESNVRVIRSKKTAIKSKSLIPFISVTVNGDKASVKNIVPQQI